MFPFVEMQASHVALIVGIGVLVVVMIRRLRRGIDSASRSTAGTAVPGNWEVEMHELARQLKGEIDTKMRALERLVQISDEATARLDGAIERAEQGGLIVERLARTTSGAIAPEEHVIGALAARAESKTKRRLAVHSAVFGADTEQSVDDDPRFERVYALADAGFTAVKIAGQIGAQVGEVELILSLRRR